MMMMMRGVLETIPQRLREPKNCGIGRLAASASALMPRCPSLSPAAFGSISPMNTHRWRGQFHPAQFHLTAFLVGTPLASVEAASNSRNAVCPVSPSNRAPRAPSIRAQDGLNNAVTTKRRTYIRRPRRTSACSRDSFLRLVKGAVARGEPNCPPLGRLHRPVMYRRKRQVPGTAFGDSGDLVSSSHPPSGKSHFLEPPPSRQRPPLSGRGF